MSLPTRMSVHDRFEMYVATIKEYATTPVSAYECARRLRELLREDCREITRDEKSQADSLLEWANKMGI
jgi:hypothetical protein